MDMQVTSETFACLGADHFVNFLSHELDFLQNGKVLFFNHAISHPLHAVMQAKRVLNMKLKMINVCNKQQLVSCSILPMLFCKTLLETRILGQHLFGKWDIQTKAINHQDDVNDNRNYKEQCIPIH